MKVQLAKENPGERTKPLCEGVSHLDEPCNSSAASFCEKCERWFCASHAHDGEWHLCALKPGDLDDIGGEG
jgi:hypothetical protein